MNFGNAFIHGMMHGALDRMFFGTPLCMPFGTASWCTPCWSFNNFMYFTPSVFTTYTPYFTGYDIMPPVPQYDYQQEIDFSKLWESARKEREQYEEATKYMTRIFAQNSSNDKPESSPAQPESGSTAKEYTKNNDEAFQKMLKFVLEKEGGYTPNDCGEAGNMGVCQSTYDEYRKNKGLSSQDVKLLTREEAEDIYYNMYYLASGADKIEDAGLALQVFDTAVNMGVSAAKDLLAKSKNNFDNYEDLRIERYEAIAQKDPEKAQFLTGWKNRVNSLSDFADSNFSAIA